MKFVIMDLQRGTIIYLNFFSIFDNFQTAATFPENETIVQVLTFNSKLEV